MEKNKHRMLDKRKNKIIVVAVTVCVSLFCTKSMSAQHIGIKTNILYDASATINMGVEFALAPKWTLDISGNWNGWNFKDNMKWKHFLIQPEARYWLCEKFNGHFFGLHLLYTHFNAGQVPFLFGAFPDVKKYRYQGNTYGAGLSYGYQWILSPRWSIEGSLGIGYKYNTYDYYECRTCGNKMGDGRKGYLAPTEAAISIIYILK